ncbi:MAG TPA: hypothetical protein VF527_18670 [Pyrinomonadaceae bacterium]|jgi:hypothetical protein
MQENSTAQKNKFPDCRKRPKTVNSNPKGNMGKSTVESFQNISREMGFSGTFVVLKTKYPQRTPFEDKYGRAFLDINDAES